MTDDKAFWAAIAMNAISRSLPSEEVIKLANDLVSARNELFPEPTNKRDEELTMVDQLELAFRPRRILLNAGVDTIEKLVSMSINELERLEGMGPSSIRDIVNSLDRAGLRLKRPYKPAE